MAQEPTGSIPAFMIAATRKSSGKTTLSLGITRALSNRGLNVATFKKGPDYIDPLWLRQASGQDCYNLDFNTQTEDELKSTFANGCSSADIAVFESNKGLFDGIDTKGSDSNAQLAKILGLPVVLVIDTEGMTRGIAPLLQGYLNFDPNIYIAGIILNKVGGPRHEAKLRKAIETYCDISVFGAIGKDQSLEIGERHLGLTTPGEKSASDELISRLAELAEQNIDLDKLQTLGLNRPAAPNLAATPVTQFEGLTIAIARDEAFGFYYADDLELMNNSGVRLEFFSPIHDQSLPKADGMFIGGGFPETHMQKLAANSAIKTRIYDAIRNGLPTYAECGGLMYLSQSIEWSGEKAEMVGSIPGISKMHKKPQGRGYARLAPLADHPWEGLVQAAATAAPDYPAHEFHYASLENLPETSKFAYQVKRGHGINGQYDGVYNQNLLANFCHLRSTRATPWVPTFLEWVSSFKQ